MSSRKGVFARWYKTGNCAVETVDLGRREERTRCSNEGDKRESSFLSPPFSLFRSLYLPIYLSIYLSIFRALPFKSPRQENFDSPALLLSSREYVVPSCFRRAFVLHPRVFVRTKRNGDKKNFALAHIGPSQFHHLHRRRCPVFLLPPFFPTLLSSLVDDAIAFTILFLVLALGALLPSLFPPFSLVSHLCFGYFSGPLALSPTSVHIVLLAQLPLLSLSFDLAFFTLSLSFSLFLSLPVFSVLFLLLYLHSSHKGQARISFSFLLLQH